MTDIEDKRRDFEHHLKMQIKDDLEWSRGERQEELAKEMKAKLRGEFEDKLDDRVAEELDRTRDERERKLAEEMEERLRDEFEASLNEYSSVMRRGPHPF